EDADGIPSGTAEIVLTGWVLGATAAIHLVAAAVGALFVGSYMLARIMIEGSRARTLARTVAVGAIALVVAGLALFLPSGDLGFGGASGDAAYQALRDDLGLEPTFDPTRFIVTGELDRPPEDEDVTPSDVAEAFAYRVAGRNVQVVTPDRVLPRWALVVPSLVMALTALIVVMWGPRDLRVTTLGASVLAGLMLLLGIGFAVRYDLFALERFGNRRLFNYAMLPFVIVVLGGGEAVLRWASTRGRTIARVASIVALAATLVTGAALLPSASWPKQEKLGSLTEQVALLEWVRSHVTCEGRILMDRRTLGTFQTMTGHAAVLEGMGPHIRPDVLVRAVRELLGADRYFRAPRDRRAFLDERGVAAIVATRPFAEFAGWQRVTKLRPDPFRDVPYLTKAYENRVGVVYLVDHPATDRSLPRVRGRPGFRC
ncbi:MAG TPA: hypothetical protein VJ887_07010, partial [Actinomycetota bacterium]|nr:hypothetical protein [Actinomycetota bacterium]